MQKMFRLTFLEKSSYFNRKYRLNRLLFFYSVFKILEILLLQGVANETKLGMEYPMRT